MLRAVSMALQNIHKQMQTIHIYGSLPLHHCVPTVYDAVYTVHGTNRIFVSRTIDTNKSRSYTLIYFTH